MSFSVNHNSTAFVLVGGLGTRLQKILPETPKPLAKIAGKPFLDLLLSKLAQDGFTQVILLAGHQGQLFQSYQQQGEQFGLNIHVCIEPQPMGSAGAVAFAIEDLFNKRLIKKPVESVLVINGDTWFEGSLAPLRQAKVSAEKPVAIGIAFQPRADRYGLVQMEGNQVLRFKEKTPGSSGWVNAGLMILDGSIANDLSPSKFQSLEKDIFPNCKTITAVKLEGSFTDIGLPEDYAQFAIDQTFQMLNKNHPWAVNLLACWLHHGSMVSSNSALVSQLQKCGFDSVAITPELSSTTLGGLTERDVCIDQFSSPEVLCSISAGSACGLVHYGPHPHRELVDISVTAEEWPRGLETLSTWLKELKDLRWYYSKAPQSSIPALFLDRDGTIIEHIHYIADPGDVELKPGIERVIREARTRGYAVVCVTNQSGLGRQHFRWDDYLNVQRRMSELLADQGLFLDAALEAAYFRDATSARWLAAASLRKPRSGMLQLACHRWGYRISQSIMVGDSLVDLQAGTTAGVAKVVYVGTDRNVVAEYQSWLKSWPGSVPEFIIDPGMDDIFS